MVEFIEKNKILISSIAVLIIVILGLFVIYQNFIKKPQEITNITSVPIVNNTPKYAFLSKDISENDKYLLLTTKIVIEEYGTYSKDDVRTLYDVMNQSTDNFKFEVQKKIDGIQNITANVSSSIEVDSSTLDLEKQREDSVIVTGRAIMNPQTSSKILVNFTLEFKNINGYWLVNNINLESQN